MYYFKQIEDGTIISVESKSVDVTSPDFVRASKTEYDSYIASLPSPPPPEGKGREGL